MATPVLTTKLHIPSLGRNLVPRQRLLERLDESLQRRLALISAPAGFGKTTLLAEWAQHLDAAGSPPVRVAWISLDEGDNDPARFSAYLTAAFRQADRRTRKGGEAAFEFAGSLLQEAFLIGLINQVAQLPQRLVLVLDDFHLIASAAIHDGVTFLVDHLPDNLHLVLAARGDPPLPLARLRARGQLIELRQSDLRFTREEAAHFLNQVMGLALSGEDVAALEARTEGWIAGLQMAALSLQGHSSQRGSRSEFVQAFTGSHRFVLDYLIEEVLEQQPKQVQRFLLCTSILDRLCAPLCDALAVDWETGRLGDWEPEALPEDRSTALPEPGTLGHHSKNILHDLDRANLFIVPLDQERHWYRYHRLFADLLCKRLGETFPGLEPELHRRASAWHEQEKLMAEAIDHALAAHDFERAASLIEGCVEATLMRSEVTTFVGWMSRLPGEWIRNRPNLCFFYAWAQLMSGGSLKGVEQLLQDMACAEDDPEGTAAGRMSALRAYLSVLQGDMHRAAEYGHEALVHLPQGDLFLRNVVAWILSLARIFDEDPWDGTHELQGVVKIGQEIENPLIAVTALCYEAKLQVRQGQLQRAQGILERALQLATDAHGRRLPIASEALIGLGELNRQWNNLEAASDHLVESIELARQWSELAAFDAYFPLVRVRLSQGDTGGAREALEAARRIALKSEVTQVDDLVADLQQAFFSISQGDIEGPLHWAEKRGLLAGLAQGAQPDFGEGQDLLIARLRKYEYLVLARLFIGQGRAAEALRILDPLLALARRLSRIDMTIEVQILRALAHQVEGQDQSAMDALAEALDLAEPGRFARVFLDEGEPMVRLLRQAASRGTAPTYAAALLAAFPAQEYGTPGEPASVGVQPLVEPLSERELEVLRLLASGMSNPEIAGELYIAVSTVRSHCKSIYGKMNVHKRWDAVLRGRELGLI